MENKVIRKHFKKYKDLKIDEMSIKLKKGVYRGDSFMVEPDMKIKTLTRGGNRTVVSKNIVNRLSPDKVDSNYFWKKAVNSFPMLSISASPNKKTIKELNEASLKGNHIAQGTLDLMDDLLIENSKSTMLEIGPGYGCIKEYIDEVYIDNSINYYAIDVNPLFKYSKLYKTDGKTISKKIPNKLDLIYSVNVFQHLSNKQRTSYYKQIEERLNEGGKFIFSMFIVTPENENLMGGNSKLFGFRDRDKNYYCNFFSQLTKVDKIEDLFEEFSNYSMGLQVHGVEGDRGVFIATKI